MKNVPVECVFCVNAYEYSGADEDILATHQSDLANVGDKYSQNLVMSARNR